MKRLLLFLFTIVYSHCSAQVFQPISAETSKEFAPLEQTWYRTYSLYVDSTTQSGDSLVYHLENVINEEESTDFQPVDGDPEECFGWGGCYKNNSSVGFGYTITSLESGNYSYLNRLGDTLIFDFTESDSTVFFQSEEEIFAIVPQGESVQDVFGNDETVQSYRIGHYSQEGDVIDSPLHNYEITVGEQTGLIDFFFTDSFPEVEKPLILIGDQLHNQSLNILYSEMIFDFQVGDTIQHRYYDAEWFPDGQPGTSTTVYETRIFNNRIEEEDSLRYEVLIETFSENSSEIIQNTVELVYPRFDTIAHLPFSDMLPGTYYFSYEEHLSKGEICNFSGYQLHGKSYTVNYCEPYDAWCLYDTQGPPEEHEYIYAQGLGVYYDKHWRNGFGVVSSWTDLEEIIYFSKSGVSCGNQAVLSTSDIDFSSNLKVFPNPAQDRVNISMDINTTLTVASIRILDSAGRLILTEPLKSSEQEVDVSGLNSGFYLIQLVSGNELFGTTKLIVK